METTSEVLLIVVSTVLAIFLVLASVAIILLIRLQRRINEIVEKAEKVAGTMEAAASAFERSAKPMAIFKLISSIVSHVKGREK